MALRTCRVKKKIDATHRLMKCTLCGNEHTVEIKVDPLGYWKSPRGARDCKNPKCLSHPIKAKAKAAAAAVAALPANVAARLAKQQAKAIENTPEGYDKPEPF